MDFVQKSNFLLSLFFTEIMSEKIVFRYAYDAQKAIIFRPKKLKLSQGRKSGHFLKGLVHRFCPKIKLSLIAVFLQKFCQKRSFFDILDRKQSFQDHKIHGLTPLKNVHCLKGLVHGFCPKFEVSLIAVFYRNYVRKDRFSIFWIENNHFQTKKLKF